MTEKIPNRDFMGPEWVESKFRSVFGPWDDLITFQEGSLKTLNTVWPFKAQIVLLYTARRLFNYVEDNALRSPLFIFENDVFFCLAHEDVAGFTVSEVLPEGKRGSFFGYPYYCISGVFPDEDNTGIAVVDLDEDNGAYVAYEIMR